MFFKRVSDMFINRTKTTRETYDERLDRIGKEAKVQLAAAKCIAQLDDVKQHLTTIVYFASENPEYALRLSSRVINHPLFIPDGTNPFCIYVFRNIRGFIDEYVLNHHLGETAHLESVIFDMAENGKLSGLIDFCDTQIEEIQRIRH